METRSESQIDEDRVRSKGRQQNKDLNSYVRDGANDERTDEEIRTDPHEAKKESVGVASKRDVSPNTPKGEPL